MAKIDIELSGSTFFIVRPYSMAPFGSLISILGFGDVTLSNNEKGWNL
jgi:hypothetical protein